MPLNHHDTALNSANESNYNVQVRHPERSEIYAEYARRSEALRTRVPWSCLRYGDAERCTIDWFPAPGPNMAPLLVFIHGGFWRGGDKRVFGFIAENLLAAGVSTAFVGYQLAPEISVSKISRQIDSAVSYLLLNREKLGFDATRVTLSGHSAGAHLAAMASTNLSTLQMSGDHMRVVGLSGVYQLDPLLDTSLNREIRLTQQEALDMSLPNGRAFQAKQYYLLVGGLETPGFISQSVAFEAALKGQNVLVEAEIVAGRTHFDIFAPLTTEGDPIHQKLLAIVTA